MSAFQVTARSLKSDVPVAMLSIVSTDSSAMQTVPGRHDAAMQTVSNSGQAPVAVHAPLTRA